MSNQLSEELTVFLSAFIDKRIIAVEKELKELNQVRVALLDGEGVALGVVKSWVLDAMIGRGKGRKDNISYHSIQHIGDYIYKYRGKSVLDPAVRKALDSLQKEGKVQISGDPLYWSLVEIECEKEQNRV